MIPVVDLSGFVGGSGRGVPMSAPRSIEPAATTGSSPSSVTASIPLFHDANWDARIACIVTDGSPARHPPITAGRHPMEKFARRCDEPGRMVRAHWAALHARSQVAWSLVSQRFYIETLGCPKNDVDSDKLVGALLADGMEATDDAALADLVVVNTCAFIDDARRESIDTILALDGQRSDGSRLVVTGCMAERYGDELAAALPEVDQVAGFGKAFNVTPAERDGTEVPHASTSGRKLIPVSSTPLPEFDLLNLPRPKSAVPWAYVKIAEGCDRSCGFCAIPSFRGPQRSRDIASILTEVDQLEAREIVLVAQDLASYGKDRPGELGAGSIVPLVRAVADEVDRVRLLYLYPSDLSDDLVDAICDSGVPYFDLSLQHVSKPLLRRMRRWGDGQRFLDRIADIRGREPDAAFRSNFIVGYPGETEADHDQLLHFVEEAQLDWCGFFSYSREDGTYAADLDGGVDPALMGERLAELRELQDDITATRRDALIGSTIEVLVDTPGVGRSHREAPEIDGIVHVDLALEPGALVAVDIVDAMGPDLVAAGVSADTLETAG